MSTGYSSELDADILELPYDGVDGTIAMYIAKPRSRNVSKSDFDKFVQRMKPDTLRKLPESLSYDDVYVEIPKMEFAANFALDGVSLVALKRSSYCLTF